MNEWLDSEDIREEKIEKINFQSKIQYYQENWILFFFEKRKKISKNCYLACCFKEKQKNLFGSFIFE